MRYGHEPHCRNPRYKCTIENKDWFAPLGWWVLCWLGVGCLICLFVNLTGGSKQTHHPIRWGWAREGSMARSRLDLLHHRRLQATAPERLEFS